MIKGHCFCQAICFEISLNQLDAYHCHCSICRKVTGSRFNTATVIDANYFQWTSDLNLIKTYKKDPTGFRHDFCSECGCTVPNLYKETKVWVPVGLLEEHPGIKVIKHIFVDSKACWDMITDDLPQHAEF